MQNSQIPTKMPVAFAASAGPSYRRTVPIPTQVPITPGAASFTDGFPPANFVPVAAGGIPPFGEDMNGVLYAITLWLQWAQAGGMIRYDSAFSASVGGYPQGAFLQNAAGTGFWLSTVENNVTNPDAGGAGWVAAVIQASNAVPLMDGVGTAGTALPYAREGHRHPTDTTRLAVSFLSSNTGTVAAVTGSGSLVTGHMALFGDAFGTLIDGGLPGALVTFYLTVLNNGLTLGNGLYMVDSSGGAFAVNLPAVPTAGLTLEFRDVTGTWPFNYFTLNRNGNTIMGVADNLICNTICEDFVIWYNGSTWRLF